MKTSFELHQINAFTIESELFSGNPASICLLQNDDDIDDNDKQKIAEEVNQSMTAFVSYNWHKNENSIQMNGMNNSYKIRFFTPTKEFLLCGHASVAASLLLSRTIQTSSQLKVINYETKFGHTLKAFIDANESITLSMPIDLPKTIGNIANCEKWTKELVEHTIGDNLSLSLVEEIVFSARFLLICITDSHRNNIYKISPNMNQLSRIGAKYLNSAIIVTQIAKEENIHFYSRVFSPWNGVDEDPVCGSAHTLLTPYWKKRLSIDGQLIGKQCSARGGILKCFQNNDRIELTGNARIAFSGTFYL